MVGGVSPGKGGQEHLGLPVFDSVAEVYRLYILLLQAAACFILYLSAIYYGYGWSSMQFFGLLKTGSN